MTLAPQRSTRWLMFEAASSSLDRKQSESGISGAHGAHSPSGQTAGARTPVDASDEAAGSNTHVPPSDLKKTPVEDEIARDTLDKSGEDVEVLKLIDTSGDSEDQHMSGEGESGLGAQAGQATQAQKLGDGSPQQEVEMDVDMTDGRQVLPSSNLAPALADAQPR